MVVVAFGLVSMRKRRRWTVTRSVLVQRDTWEGLDQRRPLAADSKSDRCRVPEVLGHAGRREGSRCSGLATTDSFSRRSA
jgi:hypothetical protein